MAFWTDNISNISDEELCKDDLHLDSILAKEITLSEDVEDQEDRGSVISEVVDLSWPSKKATWINDKRANIEESRAVDLSLRSKAPCSISEEEELTLEESSVCPDKSQKEDKLLDILRLASRPTGDQGMLCHLCDLEVGSMGDLQAHFESEHSDCFPKIPCSRKEDSFDVEEMGVVEKNYGALGKSFEDLGKSKKKKPAGKLLEKFPCIVCKKKFSVRNVMKNHVRKVHFAKVVPCGLCEKQVKELNMREHNDKYHPQ